MIKPILGKKQTENNDRFAHVWAHIQKYVSKDHIDNLIDKTVQETKDTIQGKKCGYGWSGGKDSVALKFIMDEVGVYHSVMGMTHNLEFPAFMKYATLNMPDGLDIYNSGLDLNWLASNLQMLFPKDSKTAAKWFSIVQHKAQVFLRDKYQLELLILGRRKQDSNYVGKGTNIYYNKGQKLWRYSPLSDWLHEEVMGLMYYYDLPLSPCYSWPNGWVVGSGNWAARQWTGSTEQGWREIHMIDNTIVEFAATKIQSAEQFLNKI